MTTVTEGAKLYQRMFCVLCQRPVRKRWIIFHKKEDKSKRRVVCWLCWHTRLKKLSEKKLLEKRHEIIDFVSRLIGGEVEWRKTRGYR